MAKKKLTPEQATKVVEASQEKLFNAALQRVIAQYKKENGGNEPSTTWVKLISDNLRKRSKSNSQDFN